MLPATGRPGFAIAETRGGRRPPPSAPTPPPAPTASPSMFDPADRRWRYPFINCTHCGPRFTITRALPYDRAHDQHGRLRACARRAAPNTAARPTAASTPSPTPARPAGRGCALLDADGAAARRRRPRGRRAARIRRGKIVAVKGLGGFHLVCDARNAAAVAALRARKQREEKPFAVMVANVASAAAYAEASARRGASCCRAPSAPSCCCASARARMRCCRGVAPGLAWLGVMLPVHAAAVAALPRSGRPPGRHRLAAAAAGAGAGDDQRQPRRRAPGHRQRRGAGAPGRHRRRLPGARPRHRARAATTAWCAPWPASRRAASSSSAAPAATRRGPSGCRGRARRCWPLGGHFKNTVCVTRGDEAFVSQHVGDLDNAPTCRALDETVAHLLDILQVEPAVVAHDLHPDFYSTRLAARLAAGTGLPLLAVQHHHAHIAAVLAEHRVRGPVLGLAHRRRRPGHRRQRLGRRTAARRRRRLHAAGPPAPAAPARRRPRRARTLAHGRRGAVAGRPRRRDHGALRRRGRGGGGGHAAAARPARARRPAASAAGSTPPPACWACTRRMAFEGQAAMLLEGLAEAHGPVDAEPAWSPSTPTTSSTSAPWRCAWPTKRDAGRGAALFHATLVAALADWVARAAARSNSTPSPAAAAASSMPCSPPACGANWPARPDDARGPGRAAQRRRPRARPGLGGAAGRPAS